MSVISNISFATLLAVGIAAVEYGIQFVQASSDYLGAMCIFGGGVVVLVGAFLYEEGLINTVKKLK